MKGLNVVIIGASGGIGSALTELLSEDPLNTVYAFSRSTIKHSQHNIHNLFMDLTDEHSISTGAQEASSKSAVDMVVVASGLLHDANMQPEKSLRDLDTTNLQKVLLANTIGPALVAKHFLPNFDRNKRTVFAALSARIGSISDNRLGGWYAYRASKAALNMLIRTASIELARQNKLGIVVGLHPGTVATKLSEPFQKRVPKDKLFSVEYSAGKLIALMECLTPVDSGKIFAWDGKEIPA